MKSLHTKTTISFLLILILSVCFYVSAVKANEVQTDRLDAGYYLPVFGTADIHGYLAEESGDDLLYLLAFISDKVKDVRGYGKGARKDKAILLDAGDICSGSAITNVLYTSPLSAAFQFMDYDAVTLGNHDFDWGLWSTFDPDHTMADYSVDGESGENTIPVIVSNIRKDGKKAAFSNDSVILEKTAVDAAGNELPVRIGVIGFAGDFASDIPYDFFTGKGYTIDSDLDKVNAYARELESSGQCDATILLVHEDPAQIAPNLGADSPVDLVLGGHKHKNENGTTDWNLPYLEPAGTASAYACCELAFDCENGKLRFKKVVNADIVSTKADVSLLINSPENAANLDPELVALTDAVLEELKILPRRSIGFVSEPLLRYPSLPESGDHSSAYGNWIAKIMTASAGADAAFVNKEALRTDFLLEEGKTRREITLADIRSMFPFNNRIYCFELTMEELLSALTYSLSDNGKGILSEVNGIDCYYTGETVNAMVMPCGEVLYENGEWKPNQKDKKLRVAVSEYIVMTQQSSEKGLQNPFCEWAKTDRLISRDCRDYDRAVFELASEAASHSGKLPADSKPHYINHPFTPENNSRYPGHSYQRTVDPSFLNADGQIAEQCEICGNKRTISTIPAIREVTLSHSSFVYDGKNQMPAVTVRDRTGQTISNRDYSVSYSDSRGKVLNRCSAAGSYQVIITFQNNYKGTKHIPFQIRKADNPLKLKKNSRSFSKKRTKAVTFRIRPSKAQGNVTFMRSRKAKAAKIRVSSAGKVIVPKTCRKGTYRITVKASGNNNYKAGTKTFTITVK